MKAINKSEFLNRQKDFLINKRESPDLEWQDLADIRSDFYGIAEHRDTVRKGSKLLYEYLDAGWLVAEPVEPVKDDITDKTLELQKERYKIQATKIELNRQLRLNSRFELFYENVRNEIKAYPVPSFTYMPDFENDEEKEYVLTIADIHAGALFKVRTNEYSFDICKKRFDTLLNKTVDYINKNGIRKIKVITLGDDVTGILRVSDLMLNETSVVRATVFVAKTIAAFLNSLSEYCYVEYYHTPSSNHSQTRPLGTKANEIATEDMEFVIGSYIEDVLINNHNVIVNNNFGENYINFNIFDFKAIGLHGHTIKSVENVAKDLSMKHRVFYDYVFLAHFHSSCEKTVDEAETSDVEYLICPSFIGTDPFSDKICKGAKSACKLFVFDNTYGHTGTEKFILN